MFVAKIRDMVQRNAKILMILALVLLGVSLLLKTTFNSQSSSELSMVKPGIGSAPSRQISDDAGVSDEYSPQPTIPASSSPDLRLIIKNASLSITTTNIDDSTQTIKDLTAALGGFVVQANISTASYKGDSRYGSIIIRVPSERFDEAMTTIKNAAKEVTTESVTGQDVTEEYTDLSAQLKNLEATEAELRELFARTGSVTEILQVQKELTTIRSQIEVLAGRIQYLTNSAKMSAITVSLTEEDESIVVNKEWNLFTIAKEAAQDLVTSLQNLASTLTYALIYYGPYVGVITLIAWIIARKTRRTKMG